MDSISAAAIRATGGHEEAGVPGAEIQRSGPVSHAAEEGKQFAPCVSLVSTIRLITASFNAIYNQQIHLPLLSFASRSQCMQVSPPSIDSHGCERQGSGHMLNASQSSSEDSPDCNLYGSTGIISVGMASALEHLAGELDEHSLS